MKKAGPILLAVLFVLLGYTAYTRYISPPGGDEYLEDMERVLSGVGANEEENNFLALGIQKNHKEAFKAARSAPKESEGDNTASTLYIKTQFLLLIDQAKAENKTKLADTLLETGRARLGRREFK